MKKKRITAEDIVLDLFVYGILIGLTIVTFYPMWYVMVASFSTGTDLIRNPGILFWPKHFNVEAYKLVFNNSLFLNGFKNTIVLLGVSLPINIFMTLLCAYFMARQNMMWKKPIVMMIMFTMFFSGGLVPNYLNIKDLGLHDTLWALVIPGAINVYNAIICKSAIEGLPDSLMESARIDGATDFRIIFKIIMPLIMPTLAVLILYYGVAKWNAWFNASIYITSTEKLPLQNILRSVLLENSSMKEGAAGGADEYNAYAEAIKYAAIIVSTVPILCVYPFLQKYFAKGTMVGAVKG